MYDLVVYEKSISGQIAESQMSFKTLEKSSLEPAAPIRLADQKHCALSTQPNPHLPRWRFGWVNKAQCFRLASYS